MTDTYIKTLIEQELYRQNENIELIASENVVSKDILEALGSVLTNKYAEGYPGKRYYGGCKYIDEIEQAAIDRACKLFNCKYANVQPHSGSQANAAAYRALKKYLIKHNRLDDTRDMRILSLRLDQGGHLSHGSDVSFSSDEYLFDFYPLDKTGHLNFDLIESKIKEFEPDVILAGYSAYPYEIDFSKFRKLADEYHSMLIVDMAHIAGLIVAKQHQNPCEYADIVTSTTHKTLRGPRGGLILTNNYELFKFINSAVFPFYQGGPLENTIAAKAVCFNEASSNEFIDYIKRVKENTRAFSERMIELGCDCTLSENHLTLLNTMKSFNITGKNAQTYLERINITTNKNMLPNDTLPPSETSGLRIGFAAATSRGCTKEDAIQIADIIYKCLKNEDLVWDCTIAVKNITDKWSKICAI